MFSFFPEQAGIKKNNKIKAAASPPVLAESLFLVGLSSPTPVPVAVEAMKVLSAPVDGMPRVFQGFTTTRELPKVERLTGESPS